MPGAIASQKLTQPVTAGDVSRSVLDRSLLGASGAQGVIVRLSADSAERIGQGRDTAQAKLSAQASKMPSCRARGARPERARGGAGAGRHERVFVEIGAAALPAITIRVVALRRWGTISWTCRRRFRMSARPPCKPRA